MIHVSSLTDDFYSFQAPQRRLIGRQSRRRFSVGDQLRVYVVARRFFKRQVDFAMADERKKTQSQRDEVAEFIRNLSAKLLEPKRF